MHGQQEREKRRFHYWIHVALIVLTLFVYGQVRNFEFVSFDDGIYVFDNSRVRTGLNADSIAWSFRFDEKNNTYWHPLTWLSHMLDVEVFGLDAGAHHLTNVALHLINVLLLFLILARMTDSPWLSGMAAAVYAVHPVNVESVAWVAERKNVLSTVFWLLTTYLYVLYAEKPNMGRYGAVVGVFTMGLLAKPMLVTLPCTLLLLDVWPLRRLKLFTGAAAGGRALPAARPHELVLEKIPLLVLSLLVTYLAMGSIRLTSLKIPFDMLPLGLRIENAVVSFATYAAKFFWPSDLAMFYPYPQSLPLWQVAASLLVLGAVTAAAAALLKARPYFMVGWLWFLGTLVPVAGIIQVGLWPAWAERWAYIPYIGLLIVVVWGANDLAGKLGGKGRSLAAALAVLALGALAHAGHRQAAVWENSVTLYQESIENIEGNYLAHNNLGVALAHRHRFEEAVFHYRESARLNPFFPYPHFNLGRYYLQEKRYEEAAEKFATALSLNPEYGVAYMGMGETMIKLGRIDEAFHHYREAQKYIPYEKKIYNDLGVLFLQLGQTAEAIHSFKAALRLDPGFVEALNNIGFAYLQDGRADQAAGHLEKALALDPGNDFARDNLQEAMAARRPE